VTEKPPPTPAPKLPVMPELIPHSSDWPWVGFVVALVSASVGVVAYGVTREPPRCIGWEPAPPVYRLMPDGGYHPERRWRCVECEAR
jgi:hypothetical protein